MTTLLYQGIDKTFNFGLDANTSNNIIFLSILIKHFLSYNNQSIEKSYKMWQRYKVFF